ncbi:hypothetical protein CCACVL1_30331 [Corchorus capsularis]|uniref:Uncharacterized protein n=1 Tax=Corchorus capsularis TaxID=210143 RepID=A0A1R3FY25_COCAP|nr:hypothetical protein CCACVL1_30331 [Corchorus capsularis]
MVYREIEGKKARVNFTFSKIHFYASSTQAIGREPFTGCYYHVTTHSHSVRKLTLTPKKARDIHSAKSAPTMINR